MRSGRVVLAIMLTAGASIGEAQRTTSIAPWVSQATDLAKLWATLRFEHPWTADRRLRALDSVTIASLEALSSEPNPQNLSVAASRIVKAIRDPATRILAAGAPSPSANRWPGGSPPGGVDAQELPGGFALISVHRYSDISDATGLPHPELRLAALQPVLSHARGVIFDMRTDFDGPRNENDVATMREFLTEVLLTLTARVVVPPTYHRVEWTGFPREVLPGEDSRDSDQGEFESRGSDRVTFKAGTVSRIHPATAARDVPIVFLVNAPSELPLFAAALLRQGAAALVSEGAVRDAPFVQFTDVAVGPLFVRVRVADVMDTSGFGSPEATAVVERQGPGNDAALARARTLIGQPRPFPVTIGVRLPALLLQTAPYVPRDSFPSAGARIFALVKFWGVINRFYETRHELTTPWDDVIAELLPTFRDASNTTEYWVALGRLTNRLRDSHANLSSPQLAAWRGVAILPFLKTIIDGRLVVTRVASDSLLRGARVRPGDIVRAIDGRDAIADGRRVVETGSSSSDARVEYDVALSAGRGPAGSTAILAIEDGSGVVRSEHVPRYSRATLLADLNRGLPPPVRLLAPDIGYVDVGRVPEDSIEKAWDQLRDTKAVILDWRTWSGTTFPFVSRLMRRDLEWCRCRDSARQYSGEAVVLTDALAQSVMEVNLRALKEANGTITIGAATSGTDGGRDRVYVPGAIALGYTTGPNFNRRGIMPDFPVHATLEGLRMGRDEVIEAAVEYLTRKLRP